LFQVELDGLAFPQAVKIELLQATAMKKNFLPLCGSNKPETSVPDNSLDCSLHSHLGVRTWGKPSRQVEKALSDGRLRDSSSALAPI
jgi:hypothetical protein